LQQWSFGWAVSRPLVVEAAVKDAMTLRRCARWERRMSGRRAEQLS
jgi:hypothetical protein